MTLGADPRFAECEVAELCPVAGACVPGARMPCAEVTKAHDAKLRLCDELESIADDLPAVDRLVCLRIANELVPLVRQSHLYEEQLVFPAFIQADGEDGAHAASVRRLRAEHVEDECAAQDLTELLMAIGHGGAIANPEALGFMLRAFFEAVRRHVAFEREHVLPRRLRRAAPPVN